MQFVMNRCVDMTAYKTLNASLWSEGKRK